MTILAHEMPLIYNILSALAYTAFFFAVATVLVGLLFLLYKLVDKRRR